MGKPLAPTRARVGAATGGPGQPKERANRVVDYGDAPEDFPFSRPPHGAAPVADGPSDGEPPEAPADP